MKTDGTRFRATDEFSTPNRSGHHSGPAKSINARGRGLSWVVPARLGAMRPAVRGGQVAIARTSLTASHARPLQPFVSPVIPSTPRAALSTPERSLHPTSRLWDCHALRG